MQKTFIYGYGIQYSGEPYHTKEFEGACAGLQGFIDTWSVSVKEYELNGRNYLQVNFLTPMTSSEKERALARLPKTVIEATVERAVPAGAKLIDKFEHEVEKPEVTGGNSTFLDLVNQQIAKHKAARAQTTGGYITPTTGIIP